MQPPKIPKTITRLYWNGQLLQGFVAAQVAYFSTTTAKTGAHKKGEKYPHFNRHLRCKKHLTK